METKIHKKEVYKKVKTPYSIKAIEDEFSEKSTTFFENIDGYKIVKYISSGGESDIYLVEKNSQKYVLKLYRKNFHPDKNIIQQLQNLTLKYSDSLVKLHKFSQFEPYYEIYEYCELGSLENILQNENYKKEFHNKEVLFNFLEQIHNALKVLHLNGILHRDLKPSNILFRKWFDLVLSDFGIAKEIDLSTVVIQNFKGIYIYSAPESFINISTSKSDYWSLGIILYEVYFGKNPFEGLSQNTIIATLLRDDKEAVNINVEDKDIDLLLKGLLTRDFKKRWGEEEVERFLKGDRNIPVFYEVENINIKDIEVETEWEKFGFTKRNAKIWKSYKISPKDAYEFKKNGFLPKEAKKWLDLDIKAEFASEWRNIGIEPEIAAIAEEYGVGAKKFMEYLQKGIHPKKIIEFIKTDNLPSDNKKDAFNEDLIKKDLKKEKESNLIKEDLNLDLEKNINNVSNVNLENNFISEEREWNINGIDFNEIMKWKKENFTPTEAKKYMDYGLNLSEAVEIRNNKIDFLVLQLYYKEFNFSVQEIIKAINENIPPKILKKLKILSLKNEIIFTGHDRAVNCMSFNLTGDILASGSNDNSVKLFDLKKQREILFLKGHDRFVNIALYNPKGKILASATYNNIKLWDLSTKSEITTLQEKTEYILSMSFSSDGEILACGDYNNSYVKLWNIKTFEYELLKGHKKYIHCVSFSPEEKILASGSEDKTIKLWDISTKKELVTLQGHSDCVKSVVFSPDGKILASGGCDNKIIVWDVITRSKLFVLEGHTDSVNSLSFSPDGKILASGSEDKTIKLWDIEKRENILTLNAHNDFVNCVIFSLDGKLASSSGDKTIIIWNYNTVNLIENIKKENLSIDEAVKWLEERFDIIDIKNWKENKFTPQTAKEWKNNYFSPKEAKMWRDSEFDVEDAVDWKEKGFSIDKALVWKKAGFTSIGAKNWIDGGFNLKEAQEWKEGGFSPKAAREWKEYGFGLIEALKFKAEGCNVKEALIWKQTGVKPKKKKSFLNFIKEFFNKF
jgi:WD40 repeat protein/tRNA A-37 threonylcarbamoyl transferase component Bud32/ABC-type tungstate transport system permease subunit